MKEFWTTQEAADFLGLSASTLTKLRLSGGGPAYRKFGRCVRYTEAEVRAWADARIRRSTAERPGNLRTASGAGWTKTVARGSCTGQD